MTWLLGALLAPAGLAAQTPATVVASREWRVTREPERVEEFSGDVRYSAGPVKLWADWARFRHATQEWQARGRVRLERLLDSGERLSARGEEGRYSQRSGGGSLSGPRGVSFVLASPEGPPDEGHAGRASWEAGRALILEGGVEVWGPRLTAAAGRADYDAVTGSLRLSQDRPMVLKREALAGGGKPWSGALQADEITALRPSRALSGRGRARGWVRLPREGRRR